MIFVYQALLQFVKVFKFFFCFIPHKKIRYFLKNEGQIQVLYPLHARPIWIHASSGEIEYAKSLIREFKQLYPQVPLLITHTSISSKNSLQTLDVAAWGVAPLDTPQDVKKFLAKWNPRAFLITRTDIWPQTLIELSKLQIPTYLFSATFAEGSKKLNFISRKLLKTCLPFIKKIYFVSQDDERLCRKFFPNIKGEVIGDTRYDQVLYRLKEIATLPASLAGKVLIAGSTWEEDEKVLISAYGVLRKNQWKLILVPHEVDKHHIQKLTHLLKKSSFRFLLFSRGIDNFNWRDYDILLVDQVGILASLYPFAHVAFIGGSFRKQVHSVMEALATSSPVVVGPYFQNNREAIEFESLGFVKCVKSSEEFVDSSELLEQNINQIRPHLKSEFEKRLGATSKLILDLKNQGLFKT